MQEEAYLPTDDQLIKMARILKKHGRDVPFDVPEAIPPKKKSPPVCLIVTILVCVGCCALILLANSGAIPSDTADDDWYYDADDNDDVCWKYAGSIPDGWIVMSIADVKFNQS